MHLNLKNHRIVKVKKYLKNNDFFFFFHSVKLTSNEWTYIEQDLKKLKLKCYKVFNGTTLDNISDSVYKNFNPLISGILLFIKPRFKSTLVELDFIIKNLKQLFALLAVKLNNKIYSVEQIKGAKILSYKQNMFGFYKSLDRCLKTSYLLTHNNTATK